MLLLLRCVFLCYYAYVSAFTNKGRTYNVQITEHHGKLSRERFNTILYSKILFKHNLENSFYIVLDEHVICSPTLVVNSLPMT